MTDDVTFGTVVSGRNAPVVGIEWMTSPTTATIPMRVKIEASQRVSQLPDQTGLQHIRRLSADAARACAFRTAPSALILPVSRGVAPTNIGVPRGCYPWIVDGDSPDNLVPFGFLGELLIEGPLLGRGSLNRPDGTAARFHTDLDWMKNTPLPGTRGGQPSRRVVYRTGHFVRYNMDSSMAFIGRKDDHLKVRGQRLESGDVQAYLERVLGHLYQAVALVPKTGPLQNALVVALARISGSVSAPGDPREKCHVAARKQP